MSAEGSTPERLDRAQLQRRAVSGAMWTLLHVALSLPLAFVVNIVLARVLGVADYGRLAYLTMVMEIVGVIVMVGVGSGLIQFGAKAHSRGDHATVNSILRRTQGFRVLIGAPILTGVVLLLADVPVALLILAILFGIWVPAGFGGATAALTIQNDTARAARLAMVMNLVTQTVVVTAVLSIPEPDVVWSARMVVGGVSVIVAIFLVQRRYRRAVLSPRWPTGMPAGFWRFSVPIGLSGIVGTIALSRSEVVLLEHLSTAEQVGLYAMAFGLAGHLFAPAQALLNPLTPAISALREVEVTAIKEAFRRTVRMSSSIAGLIIGVGGPILALLVPVLYGEAFSSASGLVMGLVVVSGFLIVTYPMQTFVTARLRAGSILAVNSLSLVATVAAALLLIPWVGAWGAVLGKVAVVLTRVVWLGWREAESFMVRRGEFFAGFRTLLAASLSGVGSYWVGSVVAVMTGTALWGAAAAFAVGVSLYVLGIRLVRGGLELNDIAAIGRALPGRVGSSAVITLRYILGSRTARSTHL